MIHQFTTRMLSCFACCWLASCTLQPSYVALPFDSSGVKTADVPGSAPPAALSDEGAWWRALNDPVTDRLVQATLASNPTLGQAQAKVSEARANLNVASAAAGPTVSAGGSLGRAKAQNGTANDTQVGVARTDSITFGWEIDLFGRIRESRLASARRIDARTADASLARLSLTAQVVSSTAESRACLFSLQVRSEDIASRQVELDLIKRKVDDGFLSPVNTARAMSDLASSETAWHSQENSCAKAINELANLSGLPTEVVRNQLSGSNAPSDHAEQVEHANQSAAQTQILRKTESPTKPEAISANVLRSHPRVVAAERNVAAAYADIAVARAARYPSVSLSALFNGQWIRAAGNSASSTTWSIGPSITGAVFDNGAASSGVDAAVARWQIAVQVLSGEIRSAVQDIQNALADRQSAGTRILTISLAVNAAYETMRATEAQWHAGSVSLFELHDAARTLEADREAQINADRDRIQAWVALVKATADVTTPL